MSLNLELFIIPIYHLVVISVSLLATDTVRFFFHAQIYHLSQKMAIVLHINDPLFVVPFEKIFHCIFRWPFIFISFCRFFFLYIMAPGAVLQLPLRIIITIVDCNCVMFGNRIVFHF